MSPIKYIFDIQHLFTPLAVENIRVHTGVGNIIYRYVYVFGFRIATFNISVMQ